MLIKKKNHVDLLIITFEIPLPNSPSQTHAFFNSHLSQTHFSIKSCRLINPNF